MPKNSIWVRVNLTNECNQHCSHCYLKMRKDLKTTMTNKTIQQLTDVFEKHTTKLPSTYNSLRFLGGEPTLYPNKIKKLSENFLKVDPNVKIDLFTNGKILNKNFLKWCSTNNIFINLSVNACSLDQLNYRMKKLKKYNCDFLVFVVLIEKNLNYLKKIFELVYKYTDKISIRYERSIFTKDRLYKYSKIIPDTIQWCLDKNMIFYPEFLYEQLYLSQPKDKFYHMCGTRLFVIDPNGDVKICFINDVIIGNIFDKNFDFMTNMKNHDHPVYHYEGIPECESCEFKRICGGGCPEQKQLAYNKTNTISPFCSLHKKIIPLVLKMKERYDEKLFNESKTFT